MKFLSKQIEVIIDTLLDTDFYKYTMGQFAWKYYPDVKVKYGFINRSKVKLGKIIDLQELVDQLNEVRDLKFTMEELNYLNSLRIFSKDYLDFLSKLSLPPVFVSEDKDKLIIETEGKWCEAIYWETFILSIVNELYCRNTFMETDKCEQIGYDNIYKKIKKINKHKFKFVEFGTRRRCSKDWQEKIMTELINCGNNMLGTSNVYLAKEWCLKPIGTMAHELPMVCAGLHDENIHTLKHSHDRMLSQWYYLYGEELSIALTDTFGTDFFFNDFTKEKAELWRGFRQDSGDPIVFGHKALAFYKKYNINPKDKLIVFSDALNIAKIYQIEKEFKGKIKTAYGWGTDLTNDRAGRKPISIVFKAIEANGRPLVKLSDNLNKSMGKPATIEKYKKAFGYESTYEEPVYY